jgi:lambda family phage minor tail protein L
MRDDIPFAQASDAQLLESSGFASLLTIQLVATVAGGGTVFLRFSANQAVTWQGHTFESIPFSLVGLGSNASGEVVRPKLTLPNASGAFSPYANQGWLNNALVTRQLVRKSDLDGNVNCFSQKRWRVSKIVSLSRSMIVLELRSLFDGQNFKLPPRQFYPPEFPSVSLS